MSGFGNWLVWIAGVGITSFGLGFHSPLVMIPGCILIGAASISSAIREAMYERQR